MSDRPGWGPGIHTVQFQKSLFNTCSCVCVSVCVCRNFSNVLTMNQLILTWRTSPDQSVSVCLRRCVMEVSALTSLGAKVRKWSC